MECNICFENRKVYYPINCCCNIHMCLECYQKISKTMLCPLCRHSDYHVLSIEKLPNIDSILKMCTDRIFLLNIPGVLICLLYMCFCLLAMLLLVFPIIILHSGILWFVSRTLVLTRKPVKYIRSNKK